MYFVLLYVPLGSNGTAKLQDKNNDHPSCVRWSLYFPLFVIFSTRTHSWFCLDMVPVGEGTAGMNYSGIERQ